VEKQLDPSHAKHQEENEGQLEVEASCPHCGGKIRWHLLQRLNTCEYCDSVLYWPEPASGRGYLMAQDAIHSQEDLLDILGTYDAFREQARIKGVAEDRRRRNGLLSQLDVEEPNAPAIATIKERRKHLFRLRGYTRVHAPYVLVSVTLGFHALGRVQPADRKVFRNVFFVAEDLFPAYPQGWNFRDEGLWAAQQRFKPLSAGDLEHHKLIRPREVEVDLAQATRRWRSQRQLLASEMEPISFESDIVSSRSWLVYRPYYYVSADTPQGNEWFLLDGQFRTVAGYPTAEEVERAQGGRWDVLDAGSVEPPSIRVLPFRCPECGADAKPGPRTHWILCSNCGRVLESSAEGLEERPYTSLEMPSPPEFMKATGTAWIPFWRLEGAFELEGKRFEDVSSLLGAVLPQPVRAAPYTTGKALYVPAYGPLTYAGYDEWAFGTAAALSASAAQPRELRFLLEQPVGQADGVLLPREGPDKLAALIPGLFPGLLPEAVQRRLNPLLLKRLTAATFTPASVGLVFAPFPLTERQGTEVVGPAGAVGWPPLRDGTYPPALFRSTRRWMAKGDLK
jgi:hypothetical protein